MEPEQRLFLNVIIQAMDDTINVKRKIEEVIARQQAIGWFTTNSTDYKEVCLFADVDANWLRKKVLKANRVELKGLINEYRKLM
jgi:hypothetical protein